MLDGEPIVAIAITSSANAKTGNMVQTYILRADLNPVHALKTGDDRSVCGRCRHRPVFGGKCYVNVGQGPRSVFMAYKRGNYPHLRSPIDGQHSPNALAEIGANRMVRLGTYGDPAAVPAYIWEWLVRDSAGHTGYTHQWAKMRSADPAMASQMRRLRELVMASVDDPQEFAIAHQDGWRTFRVRDGDADPMLSREFVCPASHEGGKRLHCTECLACDGIGRKATAASVAIVVHGPRAPRRVIQIARAS